MLLLTAKKRRELKMILMVMRVPAPVDTAMVAMKAMVVLVAVLIVIATVTSQTKMMTVSTTVICSSMSMVVLSLLSRSLAPKVS